MAKQKNPYAYKDPHRQMVDYALAVRNGKTTLEKVPDHFRGEVMKLLHRTQGDLAAYYPFSAGRLETAFNEEKSIVEKSSTEFKTV